MLSNTLSVLLYSKYSLCTLLFNPIDHCVYSVPPFFPQEHVKLNTRTNQGRSNFLYSFVSHPKCPALLVPYTRRLSPKPTVRIPELATTRRRLDIITLGPSPAHEAEPCIRSHAALLIKSQWQACLPPSAAASTSSRTIIMLLTIKSSLLYPPESPHAPFHRPRNHFSHPP